MKREFSVDQLQVHCFPTRREMGMCCAQTVAQLIREICDEKGEVNIIFASSPSQLDALDALRYEAVDWGKVNAFHMDEYIGLGIDHPASFAHYIREHFFSKVPLQHAFYLDGTASPAAECARYEALLRRYPVDITIAGVGENGHMAFNDPGIADFFEPGLMKINHSLDALCRQQQVTDGWFPSTEDVPDSALTVTFPGLLHARHVILIVPGGTKKNIVRRCLEEPVGHAVPAGVARLHRSAQMFIDDDSAALLTKF